MSALRDTQAAFRAALLGDEPAAALRDISGDGLAREARLAIYRHHVADTLGDLLQAVYPVVCRLVDARFFEYAADRFIAAHPPTSPCLFEYGEAFADFLAHFEPCRAPHVGIDPDRDPHAGRRCRLARPARRPRARARRVVMAARPPSRWWRRPTGLLRRVLVLASRHARPVGRAAQSVEAGVLLVRRV